LNDPEEKRLLTHIPIGVPTTWPKVDKKPLEEIIHWGMHINKHNEKGGFPKLAKEKPYLSREKYAIDELR
jgi:hypothetical protein